MIRPVNFAYNAQTAVNNSFQVKSETGTVQQEAALEFDNFVSVLRENGVGVTVIEDTPMPHTPDSIFPNNWISFHSDNSVLLYPMYAENRRLERKPAVVEQVAARFVIERTIDMSPYESQQLFLEGTGSMVLDRDKKIAYACLSPRTDKRLFEEFCTTMRYKPVSFDAVDSNGGAIYHTNVMMCVADQYVVICLESIHQPGEREKVVATISSSGKELIEISSEQMNHFAGNMLQVHNDKGEKLLVMSTQAYQSLSKTQVEKLRSVNRIIHASLNTIETNGGGSARCMMAEIHLQKK